jgi:UDP-3-O-[3-hydroxymyristoyl] glucosamine N-acyltransferase
MKLSVEKIAGLLGADIEGDATTEVDKIAKIEEGTPGSICFLANPKYIPFLYTTQATAVIVSRDFQPTQSYSATLLRVDDPYGAFRRLLEMAQQAQQPEEGIEQPSFVHATATMGSGVYIGAFAYIGKGAKIGNGARIYPHCYVGEGVEIGEGTILYPGVTVYAGCKVGKRSLLHAGVCIGSDGFGFAPQEDGSFAKIPQTGGVIVGDDVEIGANAAIDRATMGNTELSNGVKLDNLVHIAHNVTIGMHTAIAAQVGIAGSTQVGTGCMMGGQAGIAGHLRIANGTKIDAQSGINKSILDEGLAFRGSPAQRYRQQLKSEVLFRKLEEMQQKIQQLESQMLK